MALVFKVKILGQLSVYTDQCAFSSVHIKRFIGWNQIETAAQGYSNFLRAGSVFDGSTTLVQLTVDWMLVCRINEVDDQYFKWTRSVLWSVAYEGASTHN